MIEPTSKHRKVLRIIISCLIGTAAALIVLSLPACAGSPAQDEQQSSVIQEKQTEDSREIEAPVAQDNQNILTETSIGVEDSELEEEAESKKSMPAVGDGSTHGDSIQLKPEVEMRPKLVKGSEKPAETGKSAEDSQIEPLKSADPLEPAERAGRAVPAGPVESSDPLVLSDPVVPEEPVDKISNIADSNTPGNTSPDTKTAITPSDNEDSSENYSVIHTNPLLTEDIPYMPPIAAQGAGAPAVLSPAEEQADETPLLTPAEIDESAVSNSEPDRIFIDPAVSAAAPTRLLESPGEFTITLEGLGWIFRSDRSSPGSWRFLERKLDGNSTAFRFVFTESGNWNLIFERQDLSSGGSEDAVRNVMVEDDGETFISNGPFPKPADNAIPGTMPGDAAARNDAAVAAVDEGRFDQAMEYWEKDAARDDDAGIRARESLMVNAARSGSIAPLITWLPEYLNDNPDPDTLAEILDVFEGQAGYEKPGRLVLEKLAESDEGLRRPEWLFRLAYSLEQPGEYRDLDQAAAYYQEVITQWPLSNWRDKSEERLFWLQRHYFRVR